MNKVVIKIVKKPQALMPAYQTSGSAGADICACLEKDLELLPGQRMAVPTGLFMEIPCGYEVQIRPRSGLAIKNGITCLNSPGTIDSDYRGEIKVILINLGQECFSIKHGDRIAQMLVAPVVQAQLELSDQLSDTARGVGGFGSTGV